jgi:hypothetical protein
VYEDVFVCGGHGNWSINSSDSKQGTVGDRAGEQAFVVGFENVQKSIFSCTILESLL